MLMLWFHCALSYLSTLWYYNWDLRLVVRTSWDILKERERENGKDKFILEWEVDLLKELFFLAINVTLPSEPMKTYEWRMPYSVHVATIFLQSSCTATAGAGSYFKGTATSKETQPSMCLVPRSTCTPHVTLCTKHFYNFKTIFSL